jgi:hypothetical protein
MNDITVTINDKDNQPQKVYAFRGAFIPRVGEIMIHENKVYDVSNVSHNLTGDVVINVKERSK